MSKKETGGPAFWTPNADNDEDLTEGMTLRDYFAAKAIQSINWNQFRGGFPEASRAAYLFADAMLKARNS